MSHAGPSTAALQTSGTTKRLSTHAKAPQGGGKPAGTGTGALNTGSGTGSGGPGHGLGTGTGAGALGKEVLNPGELCGFVDTLLSQLETRFDEMSEQVLIDELESTIQDLMNADIDVPAPQAGAAPISAPL